MGACSLNLTISAHLLFLLITWYCVLFTLWVLLSDITANKYIRKFRTLQKILHIFQSSWDSASVCDKGSVAAGTGWACGRSLGHKDHKEITSHPPTKKISLVWNPTRRCIPPGMVWICPLLFEHFLEYIPVHWAKALLKSGLLLSNPPNGFIFML